jgi:two-component system copper resistance phosphate regulon response regulator CusR
MPSVLVVEDQDKLRANLIHILREDCYDVTGVRTGEEAIEVIEREPFDAMILDLSLPGRDGLSVLAELRAAGFRSPVLILTARDSIDDRVAGLDTGADDYLLKPFAQAELLARLRALLRRGTSGTELLLRCGDLELALKGRRVTRGSRELALSQREFDLLEFLLQHKNTPVTREMLAREVWRDPNAVMTNVIDVCVNALRKKVESPAAPIMIHTVRGIGYSLKEPE